MKYFSEGIVNDMHISDIINDIMLFLINDIEIISKAINKNT